MTRLTWAEPSTRHFDTGLDRGVLYPKNGSPVPWNGLTSVDENGAESAKAYYLDGRPFLFLPTPKEFAATLKAYTYPDEFAELMGLAEMTDGMYLDSQMGDSFDLSYRTLVGNDTEGLSFGYKIHLIYNATVAPQSKTYDPVGSEINPVEFSWEIQAVPVPVTGYRPTAHIVIDTRHMDSSRLDAIEKLLYGDDSVIPSMPSPHDIFEALNYGDDSVVIIDNGDGTWEAQGSYRNVYPIEDGVYQIDNAYVAMYVDGRYIISSDPITGILPMIEEPLNA